MQHLYAFRNGAVGYFPSQAVSIYKLTVYLDLSVAITMQLTAPEQVALLDVSI